MKNYKNWQKNDKTNIEYHETSGKWNLKKQTTLGVCYFYVIFPSFFCHCLIMFIDLSKINIFDFLAWHQQIHWQFCGSPMKNQENNWTIQENERKPLNKLRKPMKSEENQWKIGENHRKQLKLNKNIVKSSKHEGNQWKITKMTKTNTNKWQGQMTGSKNDRIQWQKNNNPNDKMNMFIYSSDLQCVAASAF